MHSHTLYGDGQNSPEEMVRAAASRGFVSIGIAEHAWAPYDLDVCIPKSKIEAYRADLATAKKRHGASIEVCCGLEVDYYHLYNKSDWDYVVGSVHYVRSENTGEYFPVDRYPADLEAGIADAGGVQSFIESYGNNVLRLAKDYSPTILGHIDLITKLNRGNRFFDPGAGWYKSMWEKVIKTIARSGCIAEVNTGGMARGYTDQPYPSHDLLRMLHREGVPVTLCSDAHEEQMLGYAYPQAVQTLREIGYESIKLWRGGGFTDYTI